MHYFVTYLLIATKDINIIKIARPNYFYFFDSYPDNSIYFTTHFEVFVLTPYLGNNFEQCEHKP